MSPHGHRKGGCKKHGCSCLGKFKRPLITESLSHNKAVKQEQTLEIPPLDCYLQNYLPGPVNKGRQEWNSSPEWWDGRQMELVCLHVWNWILLLTYLNIPVTSSNELGWSSHLQTATVENLNNELPQLKSNQLNMYGTFFNSRYVS